MSVQGKLAGRALQYIALALMLVASVSFPAAAQTYPSRPIRIVVPLPPGANGDLMPRILAQHLSAKLGQPVVIENRPGAAQNLGAELVYRAEPDGYTLLATPQGPLVISQSFFPKLGFDPREFVPVTIMAKLPYILVVHPKLPVATFAEFIATAKANPGKLNYGTPGLGSSSHLTGEMLKLASHIEMTHVPYGGLAPALTDLLAGHTDVMTANLDSVLAQVQEGKLRGLAVTSEKRAPEVPDLPAMAETYPEVVSTSWFAVVAPPKTPPDIAEKLSRAFAEILHEPEVEKKWREMALTPVGGTPDEVGAFLKAETARWRNVIVSGGIKRQ
jgi:tripartite-type tricarboxylate transporter receptor subunit TctC